MPNQIGGKLYTIYPMEFSNKIITPIVDCHNLNIPVGEELQNMIDDLVYVRDELGEEWLKEFNDKRQSEADEELRKMYEEAEHPKPFKKPKRDGYVYLIKEKFSGTYKIGKTKNLQNRSSVFSIKLPFDWDFVVAYKSSDYELLENILHEKFIDKRLNGEWFELNRADLKFFESEILADKSFQMFGIEAVECPKR